MTTTQIMVMKCWLLFLWCYQDTIERAAFYVHAFYLAIQQEQHSIRMRSIKGSVHSPVHSPVHNPGSRFYTTPGKAVNVSLTNRTQLISHRIMPIVINALGGGHTDTHAYQRMNQINFKKPGMRDL